MIVYHVTKPSPWNRVKKTLQFFLKRSFNSEHFFVTHYNCGLLRWAILFLIEFVVCKQQKLVANKESIQICLPQSLKSLMHSFSLEGAIKEVWSFDATLFIDIAKEVYESISILPKSVGLYIFLALFIQTKYLVSKLPTSLIAPSSFHR